MGSMHVGDYSAGLRLQIFGIKENVKTIQDAFAGIQIPEKFKKSFTDTLGALNGSIEKYEKSLNSAMTKPGSVKIAQANFTEVQSNLKNMEALIAKISGVPIKLQFNPTEAAEIGKLITKLKEYDALDAKINKRAEARKQLATEQPLYTKSSRETKAELNKILEDAEDFDAVMSTINKRIAENAAKSKAAIKEMLPSIKEDKLGADLNTQKKQLGEIETVLKSITTATKGDAFLTKSGDVRGPITKSLASLGLPDITTIKAATDALATLTKIKEGFAGSAGSKDLDVSRFAAINEQYANLLRMQQIGKDIESPFRKIDELITEGLNANNLQSIDDFTAKYASLKKEISDKTFLSEEGKGALFSRVAQQLDQARISASGLQQKLDSLYTTAKKGEKIDEQFNMIASNLKYTFSLVNGFYMAQKVIRQAYQSVKELDASMNEIAVVTTMTTGDLWGQIEAYNQLASSMGATVKGAYDVAKLYYQQGKSLNDVNALTTETLKLSRISGVEYSKATDFMTAALNGFKLEVKDAGHVSDVYSNLAAKAAVDTEEIAYAMTKTASIANNAGMSIENTAALLTQMMETTREAPENIGTAMKTIIARFAEMKMAIGNTFTNEDGEIIDVNRVEKALRSAQVSLRDSMTGEIRPVDEIFLELASKWEGLTKNTQRYIATLAAGSRQQSRFIAMMDNYKRTMELVSIAENSAGAADEQFAKTLDSLESKLNKLSNAWTTYTTGITNADFIKVMVDIITGAVNAVNSLSDIPVLGAFMKGGTAIAGFTALSAIMTKVVKDVNLFAKTMNAAESGTIREGLSLFRMAKSNQKLISQQQKIYTQTKQQILSSVVQAGEDETDFLMRKNERLSRLDAENEAKMSAIKANERRDFNLKDIEEVAKFNTLKAGIEKAYDDQIAQAKTTAAAKLAEELAAINTTDLEARAAATKLSEEKLTKEVADLEINRAKELAKLEDPRNKARVKLGTKITKGLGSIGALFGKTGISAIVAGGAAIAGVAAIIGVFTVAMIKLYKSSNKYKLKKVNEEISNTKKILETAETAYKDLSEGQKTYNEMNTSLSQLTKGTMEYSQALSASNQQVLSLLETYPQLINQITREDGKLAISAEGWDTLLESQQKTINAANGALTFKRMQQNTLRATQGFQDINIRKDISEQTPGNMRVKGPIEGLTTLYGLLNETIMNAIGIETGQYYFTADDLRKLVIQYQGNAENKKTMSREEFVQYVGGEENASRVLAAAQQEEYLKLQNQMLLANQADMVMSADKVISPFQQQIANFIGQTFDAEAAQARADTTAKGVDRQTAAAAIAASLGGSYTARNGKVFENAFATKAVEGYSTKEDVLSAYADILAAGEFEAEVKKQEENIRALLKTAPELTNFYDNSQKDTKSYYDNLQSIIDAQFPEGQLTDEQQKQKDFAEGLKDARLQTKRNAAKELKLNFAKFFPEFSMMLTSEAADALGTIDYEFLNKILPSVVGSFGRKSGAQVATQYIDIATTTDLDFQKRFRESIGNIDFTNALTSLHDLNIELSKADGTNQELFTALQKTKDSLDLSGTNLFKTLATTDNFNELYSSLTKIYATNKDIEASDISDLVDDYKELGIIIDDAQMPAATVAQLLESMVVGDIGLEDINDQLIDAITNATSLSNVINTAFENIDTFKPGRSEKEISDAYAGYAKNIADFFAEGAFGDTQLRNYWAALFGQTGVDEFDAVMSQSYSSIEERNAAITNGLASYLDIIAQIQKDGNLYSLWGMAETNAATAPDGKLAGALTIANGIVDVNTDIIRTASQMQDLLTGEGKMSPEVAAAMVADLKRMSAELAYTWDQQAAEDAAQGFLAARKIITEGEKENFFATLPDSVKNNKEVLASLNAIFDAYEQNGGTVLKGAAADWYNQADALDTLDTMLKATTGSGLDYAAAVKDQRISVNELRRQLKVLNLTQEQEDVIINKVAESRAKEGEQLSMQYEYAIDGAIRIKNFTGSTMEDLNQQITDWIAEMQPAEGAAETGLNTEMDVTITTINDDAVKTWAATPISKTVTLIPFFRWFARGKTDSYEGPGMVGEDGTELIQTKRGAYLADGPMLTHINRDDVVYTASQTKKILDKHIPISFPRFDLGYGDGITIGAPTKTGTIGTTATNKKDFKNDLDKQYNLLQVIEEILRRQEKLQESIEEASNISATAVTDNLKEQIRLTQAILNNAQVLLDHRKEEVAAFLKENEKYKDFGSYDVETGLVSIDWDKINKEGNKDVLEYIDKLEELQENVLDAEDKLDEANKTLKELQEQGKDTYTELESRLYDAIVEREQMVIDKLSANNDAINDSNDRLINSLQSSIDQQRQARENANTESDIAEKQRRIALLKRDTSGSYALEIKQLEEDIKAAQEDYTDTLVDQAIQQLQDSYDLAAESREREIAMLENQQEWREENGYYWNEVLNLLSGSAYGMPTDQAAIDQIMALLSSVDEEYIGGSEEQRKQYLDELTSQFSEALGWYWTQSANQTVTTRQEIIDNGKGLKTIKTYGTTTYYDPNGEISGVGEEQLLSTTNETYSFVEPVQPTPPKTDRTKKPLIGYIYKGVAYRTLKDAGAAAVQDVINNYGYPEAAAIKNAQASIKKQYKTGGLADYTGPAWLDGTKSRPELVLNANDTANFIQLKNILDSILGAGNFSVSGTSGDKIEVYVSFDKLDPTTNIDEIVSKVENAIIKKATYRNVNVLTRSR